MSLVEKFCQFVGTDARHCVKYSPDQPRDERGRWASATFSGYATGVPVDTHPPEAVATKQMDINWGDEGKFPDERNVSIPVKDLIATQEPVRPGTVQAYQNDRGYEVRLDTERISVIRYQGKNYVADGHHRLLAALRDGQHSIVANIWNAE